jgi:hypothetical protein
MSEPRKGEKKSGQEMSDKVAATIKEKSAESLRDIALGLVRRFLPPLFPPAKYRDRPLAMWPPIIGLVHDIKLPRRTRSQGPTGASNINILLAMIDRTLPLPGDLAECGVFRGASLVPMAIHLRQAALTKQLFGFDSFA